MGEVCILREAKMTPEQLLADALERAKRGEFARVILVALDEDGQTMTGWSRGRPGDLAIAAAVLNREFLESLED